MDVKLRESSLRVRSRAFSPCLAKHCCISDFIVITPALCPDLNTNAEKEGVLMIRREKERGFVSSLAHY